MGQGRVETWGSVDQIGLGWTSPCVWYYSLGFCHMPAHKPGPHTLCLCFTQMVLPAPILLPRCSSHYYDFPREGGRSSTSAELEWDHRTSYLD